MRQEESTALWGFGSANKGAISCSMNVHRAIFHYHTQSLGFRAALLVVSLAPSYCVLVSQNKVDDCAGVHGSDPRRHWCSALAHQCCRLGIDLWRHALTLINQSEAGISLLIMFIRQSPFLNTSSDRVVLVDATMNIPLYLGNSFLSLPTILGI